MRYVFVDGKLFEQKEQPARRDSPRGATPNGNVANVGGSYAITIEVPGQSITGNLNLVQQGTILTGEMVTQLGTTPIKDGKVTADGFTFSGSVEYGGSQIEIVVKGSVAGNNISGSIDSPQGVVPFSGTRNP